MSAIYDNWERLVAAVLKKEQLWQLFHDHSRSPSILSEASDLDSNFDLRSRSGGFDDLSHEFARLVNSSSVGRRKFRRDFVPAISVKVPYWASPQFLDQGNFGATYVVQLDTWSTIVVKRLKPMAVYEEFKRHMEIVGNVSHENVVSLRAYYSYNYRRLMLYDYYSRGSVYALLYDMSDSDTLSVLALKNG